jgi:hypothetical protein
VQPLDAPVERRLLRSITLLKLRNVADAFLNVAEAGVGHLD